MRGNENVLTELNKALQAELMAILQYIVHAEMQNNWGYGALGAYTKKQAIDEMRHAERLIERILFLDGTPQMEAFPRPNIGANVKAMLENDLAAEVDAVRQYNDAVQVCVAAGDSASREMFEKMVVDEEKHADHLEAQLDLIRDVGLPNYLARKMGAEGK